MKEIAIVAALRGGNLRRALEFLLETYEEELYGYCARLVGSADVLGVYNQVLSAAADHLTAVPVTTSIRAWLYQIARHAVTHHHRKDRRDGALAADYVPVTGPEGRQADPTGSAAQLALVDARVREMLQLSLWNGLRLEEVSQITGHSLATVRQMLAGGLARLAAESHRGEDLPS